MHVASGSIRLCFNLYYASSNRELWQPPSLSHSNMYYLEATLKPRNGIRNHFHNSDLLDKTSLAYFRSSLPLEPQITANKLLTNDKHGPLLHLLESSDKLGRMWFYCLSQPRHIAPFLLIYFHRNNLF